MADRKTELRKSAADRSRQRHHRRRGDLERSLTLCAFCEQRYHAALGVCDCKGAREARRRMDNDAA